MSSQAYRKSQLENQSTPVDGVDVDTRPSPPTSRPNPPKL
jgi:hypothetical protein